MNEYLIKHCKVRQRKGLRAWAVFEVHPSHDPELFTEVLIGVSSHDTQEEAEAAMAALKIKGGE